MFSSEFCKIFKTTVCYRTLPVVLNVIDSTIDFQKVEVATCVLERLKDSEYMTIKNVV